MPEEIRWYGGLDKVLERTRELASRAIECRLKWNKDNAKIKIRTKRKLYTLVLTPERLGTSSEEEFKAKVKEIADSLNCPKLTEIQ